MDSNKKIWLYGKHAVIAALLNKRRKIYKLLATQETHKQVAYKLTNKNHNFFSTTNKELDSLFPKASHQGIALQTNSILRYDINSIPDIFNKNKSLIIVLDQLTDPQNIGNIIRSADAFNADAILTPKNKSFSETPTLAKTACGSLEHIPIVFITNLASTIKYLKQKEYWIIGLDSNTTQYLHEFKFTPKIVLILGAEGSGLRELTQKNCDFLLKIKMNKSAESINVSNACAIAAYSYFKNQC